MANGSTWPTADLSPLTAARPADIRAVSHTALSGAHADRAAVGTLADFAPRLATAWRNSAGASACEDAVRRAADRLLDAVGALEFAARLLSDFADRIDAWRSRSQALLAEGAATSSALTAENHHRIGVAGSTYGGDFKVGRLLNAIHRDDAELASLDAQLTALTQDATSEAIRLAGQLRGAQTTLDQWNAAVTAMPGSAAYRRFLSAWSWPAARSIPTDPAVAAAWWADLNSSQRQALLTTAPRLLGNADGLPADVRDQANRAALHQDLRSARAAVAAAGGGWPGPDTDPSTDAVSTALTTALTRAGYSAAQVAAIRGALTVDYQLRHVAADFPPGGQVPGVQMLIYDPSAFDGRGRVAVALGDVAGARNVAVCVPGMTSEVAGYLDNQLSNAAHLFSAAGQQDASGAAVVAYIGYRAPDVDLGVTDTVDAEHGAHWLAADLTGLAAMRTNGPAFTTVIGHSYGSTTVATTFAEFRPPAQQVVLIGSPGAGSAHRAADLGLPPGRVLVGSCSSDPVTTKAQAMQDAGGALVQGAATGAEFGWQYGGRFNQDPAADALIGGAAGLAIGAVSSQALAPELGVDPADRKFGAVRFRAETGDKDLTAFANHSQYYRPGSESLENLAKAVTDHVDRLTTALPRSDPNEHWIDTGDDPEYERR